MTAMGEAVQKPFAHTAPKLEPCARAARFGATGRSASRTHTICLTPVVHNSHVREDRHAALFSKKKRNASRLGSFSRVQPSCRFLQAMADSL